jgi:hypothetical protein
MKPRKLRPVRPVARSLTATKVTTTAASMLTLMAAWTTMIAEVAARSVGMKKTCATITSVVQALRVVPPRADLLLRVPVVRPLLAVAVVSRVRAVREEVSVVRAMAPQVVVLVAQAVLAQLAAAAHVGELNRARAALRFDVAAPRNSASFQQRARTPRCFDPAARDSEILTAC